jgi:hypothetical protein
LVALASLFPLTIAQVGASDPAWTRPALLVAGVAAMVAAVLLWVARRRLALVLAIALVLLGIAGTVVAEGERHHVQAEQDKWGGFVSGDETQRGAILSKREAEAVPKGLTPGQLRERLGPPAAAGIQRVFDAPDLRCLEYRRAGARSRDFFQMHAFCFQDGRYAVLREW